MPLENANTIAGLDQSWPLGGDPASRGDDHLRLLKAVLKAQFPGSGGRGFSKPITVTEDQLNALPGRIDNMGNWIYPVGSVVLRMDNINPGTLWGIGQWTLITGDASLAFGDGGNMTGVAFGSNNPDVPLPRHGHTMRNNLSIGSAGNHSHGGVPLRQRVQIGGSTGTLYSPYADGRTEDAGEHNHSLNGDIYVEETGSSSATINVRGARILINVWRRIA